MGDSTFMLDSTLRSRVEEVTAQTVKLIFPEMQKRSKVLDRILKAKAIGGSGGKPMSLPTFENDFQNVYFDGNYAVTTANKNDFWINYGDPTRPTNDRNMLKAQFEACKVGWAMQITKGDMIKISGGARSTEISKFLDWYENYWTRKIDGFTVTQLDSIWNGSGSATRSDGESRSAYYGIDTAVGTGSYGGRTPSEWGEWSGHVFDCNSKLWNMATSVTNSIANLLTKQTSVASAYFFRLLYGLTMKYKMFNGPNSNGLIIMTPAQYFYIWLLVVEAQRAGIAPRQDGKETSLILDEFSCNGFPIVVEDTILPTDNIGTSYQYLKANTYIDMINLDDIVFEANAQNNFETSPFEKRQGVFEVYEKVISAMTIFYMKRRWGSCRLKLYADVVTELDALSDPINN